MIKSTYISTLLLSLVMTFSVFSQTEIDDVNTISIDSTWRIIEADSIHFKNADYNDTHWDSSFSQITVNKSNAIQFKGVVWFRNTFKVPQEFRNSIVALALQQTGASVIYIDGKKVKAYGNPSEEEKEELLYDPNMLPIPIELDSNEYHTIAIRFSNTSAYEEAQKGNEVLVGFRLVIGDFQVINKEYVSRMLMNTRVRLFLGTFFFSLFFVHLVLFLFYKKKKNNLFYALFMLCTSLLLFIPEFAISTNNPEHSKLMISSIRFVIPFFLGAFHALLYALFYTKIPRVVYIMGGLLVLLLLMFIFQVKPVGIFAIVLSLVVFIDSFRVAIVAIRKKKRGAWIVGGGVLFLLLTILVIIGTLLGNADNNIHVEGTSLVGILILVMIILAILSLPISMTIYLAWDFSMTNKELSKKLVEVKELSDKTIQQEQEKKRILEGQKEQLELEVEERTKEIRAQKEQIEVKNTEILDSIAYAKRIQSAILPPNALLKQYLPNSFVLYKPKDIVAGDFYWLEATERSVLLAAADCTGHGVPGAMVSVVCNNALNRSVREYGLKNPGEILDKTREIVIQEFEKSEEEVKDGMDIALISLKKPVQSEFEHERDASTPLSALTHTQNSHSLCYSGAHNPLWIICSKERHSEVIHSLSKGGEGESGQTNKKQFSVFEDPESDHVLIEIKANKQPIGKFDHGAAFETHEVKLKEEDTVYIFSDGYADQFGGAKGKKLKSKNFKRILLSLQGKSMKEQKMALEQEFEKWRGDIEQLDDVCVIGVRL